MLNNSRRMNSVPMSESLLAISFLAISGGLQDAYTFVVHGGVFANAQTGNIVLLSANILEGNSDKIAKYFIPLLSFSLGIMFAEFIHDRLGDTGRISWQQVVIAFEIILLFIVGLLPPSISIFANSLVSFTCAMQVQTFRKIDGCSFSSTMCIGNLRSGMESIYYWRSTHDNEFFQDAMVYFTVILLFALGAGLGSLISPVMGTHTIWISCCLLTLCFSSLFEDEETD